MGLNDCVNRDVARRTGRTINTQVVPLRTFTLAEDYHQKYLLKQSYALKAEMTRIYPRHLDFIDSTAVARLNGYAGGHGSRAQFQQDIDRLGLSDAGKQALTEMVERRWNYERQ